MVRLVTRCSTAVGMLAAIPASAAPQYAQCYPPPSYYRRAKLFGAVGGNAGKCAAIGAGVGAVGGAHSAGYGAQFRGLLLTAVLGPIAAGTNPKGGAG
jgi:hypothetical protein